MLTETPVPGRGTHPTSRMVLLRSLTSDIDQDPSRAKSHAGVLGGRELRGRRDVARAARGSALRDACPAPLLPSSRVSTGCRHVFKTPQMPRSSRSLRRVRWHLCGLTLPLYSVDCKLRHRPRCPCGPQVAQRAPRPADSLGALPTRAVVPGGIPSFLSRTGFSRRFSPFLLLGSAMSRSLQGGTSAY